MGKKLVAIITGASSGIGEATAYRLAEAGYDLSLCARRVDALERVSEKCESLGARVYTQVVDVCSESDRVSYIENTFKMFPQVDVLFNNAGLALGLENFLSASEEDARVMFETNVIAVKEMTTLVLPKMIAVGRGHLVFMGSIAGHQAYENGSMYCASKHAQEAMIQSLRKEIVSHPIRISSIDPGMVNTEFSKVRFKGDQSKADKVYDGITPLFANDIADCVYWVLDRPAHVNISRIDVFPVHQVNARIVHKKS